MSDAGPRQATADAKPQLDVAAAAARTGMRPSSWRAGVSRGRLPAPDDPDEKTPPSRRRPLWNATTVEEFIRDRPGQGARTDLARARTQRSRAHAAELAEPRPAAGAAMQQWLAGNHRALLEVADTLVDHREALLAAAGDARLREDLADAIDRAGEEISGRPSRMLASAVAYAQFLLRADGPVRVPAEAREVLARHAGLRAEFDALRNGR